MKILVSNLRLNHFAGSEIWTYQVVEELIEKGHEVELYTKLFGDVFNRLVKLGAKGMTSKSFDLAILNHVDCINDISQMGVSIKRTIQTCHGVFLKPEQPFNTPFIHQYVSITKEVQNHLVSKGIDSMVALNPCNLRRYKRNNPVNETVRKVLIICVGTQAQNTCIQACKQLNLQYEVHSKWSDPVFDLENKINEFDIVIGYGRGIIESICCGRNVIVYDSRGYTPKQGDGLITKSNFNKSLSHNFSGRGTMQQYGVNDIIQEINKATKINADWLYSQRNLFDVEHIVNKYLDEK
jgi:hypothetical protein